MEEDEKGQKTVQKLCRFTEDLAGKIEDYQKELGLRSFQTALEVICGQFFAERAKKPKEDKPS